ncbi:hypothetical protein ONE63_009381 [Megalurothrips usitatus]|uniref:K Homology domain-containing protein n=1 Tax=Megalurothrips usitatus TaxID=439358 RepID=A0AAV7XJG2_9NEOP|nr:hypothetical protein ONE63_009381 [Megalurothrips usitatus]
MSALSLQARINTRAVKKLEKPRPLKLSTSQNRHAENRLSTGAISIDEVMALADSVCQHIINGNCGSLQSNVLVLSSSLKLYGQQLETIYKDQLDRLFVTFRNGSRDEKLDYVSRLHLLELVELRGSNWTGCDNMSDYYRHKITHTHEAEILDSPVTPSSAIAGLGQFGQASPFGVLGLTPSPSPTTPQPTLLSPGEILKTSGKFPKPTKIPNKNYCKDEIVIRNSDSGKVMGIKGRRVHMIEEMSETIISFQRVNPGAKERLVQITGPTEDKIIHARQLMEDTIRRNASPVRPEQPEGMRDHHETLGGSSSSLNSSASDDSVRVSQAGTRRSTLLHSFSTNDASLGEYKYSVAVAGCVLKITGSNHDIVRAAKLVLDEYFAGQDCFDSYEEELPSPVTTTGTNIVEDVTNSAPSSELNVLVSPNTVTKSTQSSGVMSASVPAVPVSQAETLGSSIFTLTANPPVAASSSVDSSTSESDETIRAVAPP